MAQAVLVPGPLLWPAEKDGGMFLGLPGDCQDKSHCYADWRQQKQLQNFQAW